MKINRKQHEFRIIAGRLKGRKITAPNSGLARPPLTRIRRAIFDFLNPYLEGTHYLDLFSGTGSYLFEAVSRGAGSAIGVEREMKLVDSINRQAEKYDVQDVLTCLGDDVFNALPRFSRENRFFDIIMIPPPQYRGIINDTLASLRKHRIYKKGALLLCQHDTSETNEMDVTGFGLLQHRKYGNTTFTIIEG